MLDGYEQVRDFDRAELALIEPLRTLRLIHYSAWLARRWDDPAFPINFPWFGSRDYWQGQEDMLIEQMEALWAPIAESDDWGAFHLALEEIESEEVDAGLGNGGLGRLAACFM